MARVLVFAPCRVAIVDQPTNQLSIVGIIEIVSFSQFPSTLHEFVLVSLLAAEDSERGSDMVQKMVIVDGNAQQTAVSEMPFTFERPHNRLITTVAGMPINSAGLYVCKLFVKRASAEYLSEPAATFPIIVSQAE
jgi:hypothetical protein